MILCLFLYYAAWQLSARDLLCAPLNLKTSSSWTIQELQTAATKRNRKAPPKRKNESSWWSIPGSVCKVRTQDPENFDEEVKSLVTAWLISVFFSIFCPGSYKTSSSFSLSCFPVLDVTASHSIFFPSCAWRLHPKTRKQGKGMLEVPWQAVELREWFAVTRSTFQCFFFCLLVDQWTAVSFSRFTCMSLSQRNF